MFSDNFSEINYWVKENPVNKYMVEFTIQAIVKEDVNADTYFYVQQIGFPPYAKASLKKGQKIEIRLAPHQKMTNSWLDLKPEGLVFMAHGVSFGQIGFSFQKGMNTPLQFNKYAIGSNFARKVKFSINILIDNKSYIKEDN